MGNSFLNFFKTLSPTLLIMDIFSMTISFLVGPSNAEFTLSEGARLARGRHQEQKSRKNSLSGPYLFEKICHDIRWFQEFFWSFCGVFIFINFYFFYKYFLAFFNAIFGFLKVFLIYFFFNFQNSFLSFSKLFGPPHIMDIFYIMRIFSIKTQK